MSRAQVRKQKDPKMVEAGKKAHKTRKQREAELKKSMSQNATATAPSRVKEQKQPNHKNGTQSEETVKWHTTAITGATLKVKGYGQRMTDYVTIEKPWVEKHRPISLSQCIGDVVSLLQAYVKTGSMPQCFVFYGEYGDGKTTAAKAMCRDFYVLRGLFHKDATFRDVTSASNITREYQGIFSPVLYIDASQFKGSETETIEEVKERIHNFMQYSVGKWPKFCVRPDTILLGDNTPIAIHDVDTNVLGNSGLQKVIATSHRPYKGDLIKIKAAGVLPFEVTPEHPVYASYLLLTTRENKHAEIMAPLDWVEAQNLTPKRWRKSGHYLAIPRLAGEFDTTELSLEKFSRRKQGSRVRKDRPRKRTMMFQLNVKTAWLMGVYAAEGSGKQQATFVLNRNEQDTQRRLQEIGKELRWAVQVTPSKKAKAVTVKIGSVILARALRDWCGAGAHTKRIPNVILLHKNIEILKAFLEGYVTNGDGCVVPQTYDDTKTRTCITTVSSTLVQQTQLAYARLGMPSFISVVPAGEQKILGHMSHRTETYHLYLPNQEVRCKYAKVTPLHILMPIRKVERIPYEGIVCNDETTDNTYLLSNAVVHNCIVDEADRFGFAVQDNISSFIERYPKTRIIWITNFLDAIRDRIISRAAGGVIGFVKPDPKDVAKYLARIAKEERVKVKSADIMEIATKAPSVRDAVGMLQQKAVIIKCQS